MQHSGHSRFVKELHGIDRGRSDRELFRDFCSLLAYTLALPFHPEIARERLKPLAERYGEDGLRKFDTLVDITVEELEREHQDFLGVVFGMLGMGDARAGQFFTPYEISLMIAKMSLGNVKKEIKAQGFLRVSEPACGSGAMVIALRQALLEAECNPSRDVWVQMVDIAELPFLMSYIQISLYGMPATIIHGDTLLQKEWTVLHTPVYWIEGWPMKMLLMGLKDGRPPEIEKPPEVAKPPDSGGLNVENQRKNEAQITLFPTNETPNAK